MNKAVLATLCFAAGAGLGFVVGYSMTKKEEVVEPVHTEEKPVETKEPEKKPQDNIFQLKPAKIARPGEDGVNYTKFVKELGYKAESEHPEEDDPEDFDEDELKEECSETYEERLERENEEALEHAEEYKKAHKGKIDLMTKDEWDSDFRENEYDREDLYYFTEDDILADEEGTKLDIEETLGKKVGQIGWFKNADDEIYVRNHDKQKEYRVLKERCSFESWWT